MATRSNAAFSPPIEVCTRCHAALEDEQQLCPSCSQPTKFMSFKARAEYEVEQWKRYKTQTSSP